MANGQLSRKAKMVREPKSDMDMVIPCLEGSVVLIINNEEAYESVVCPNYYVTKSGKVYSIQVIGGQGKIDISRPHLLKYGKDKDGYQRVVISFNGKKKYIKVHTLIAKQFIGEIPEDMVINHKDGNKKNNCVDNLEIVTVKDNTIHARKMGLCSNEISVDVLFQNKMYHFRTINDCMNYFPDLSKHYLSQLRKGLVLYSMILFKKENEMDRRSKIHAYYNGKLLKSFDSMKEASLYFKRNKSSVSSALKQCEYRKKVNQYIVTFPNVSTIENTANTGNE